jgi:ADP-ribose pyrophosphatase YjhB (NUDIX family)
MKISHCPYCGSKQQLKNAQIDCKECGRKFHINNSPAVGILIIKKGQVLLSKRGINPFKGYWDYPGGFLEFGEHPETAAKREVLEETGLVIEILDLLGIYINKDYEYQREKIYPQDAVYVAKIKSGRLEAKDDVIQLKWFSINAPPEKISFSCVKEALKDLNKWCKKNHKSRDKIGAIGE